MREFFNYGGSTETYSSDSRLPLQLGHVCSDHYRVRCRSVLRSSVYLNQEVRMTHQASETFRAIGDFFRFLKWAVPAVILIAVAIYLALD